MKVIIAIPIVSFGRFDLLFQEIKSIQVGSYKDIHIVVVVDGNPKLYDTVGTEVEKLSLHNITVILNKKRMDWVFSINRVLKEFDSEYYIYASDDLIFPPDCIKHAMVTMQKHFPGGYGVVTLGKRNKCIFGLFGRKWADHFPNRQMLCPDYIHYCSDEELSQAVKKLKKFAFPPERNSQVEHFRMGDETRILARKARSRDRKIWHTREEKGYLWGVDFNLITRKGKTQEAIT